MPTGRSLIGLDESAVGGLFASQRRSSALGKAIRRHRKAEVSCATSMARSDRRQRPSGRDSDRKTAVRIYGGLGAVTIDPATGMLSIRPPSITSSC
jgi:hypothetical protein